MNPNSEVAQNSGTSIIKNPPFPKNYADEFLILERGRGSWVWDRSGKKYLDLASGIAVNSLGHRNSVLLRAMKRQSAKLIHVSNLFTTSPAVELAESLVRTSPLAADQPWQRDKHPGYFAAVHFGNSGSEANESALKYAKIYSQRKSKPNGKKLLAFRNGFHGRTLGALSVTYTEKYRKPYEPLLEGVEFIDFNDADAVKKTLNSDFAAVIVEPVQGEGGLDCMSHEFAQALNEACSQHDVLLIADEVQSGLYRTGALFASQHFGLKPDIITLSKPIAGGLPLSATLIPAKVNELVHVGDHGTTFGGGPLTTAVAGAIWQELHKAAFQKQLEANIALFSVELAAICGDFGAAVALEPVDGQAAAGQSGGHSPRAGATQSPRKSPKNMLAPAARGLGMLRGIRLLQAEKLPKLLADCRERGLIVLRSGNDVLRIAPPLTVSEKELKQGFRIIRSALEEL